MAEKYQQPAQGYPVAPATIMPRSDAEYVTNYQSQEQMKKKKRMKCLAYIAALAVIQTIIILVFVLVVVRVRTPRVRLGEVTVANAATSNVGTGDVVLTARVSIRNRNLGRYEFDSSLATIRSGNSNVGQFVIDDARVRARSTRRIYATSNLMPLSTNSSVLDLNVQARLRGKVRVLWVIRRNRSADMNCTMTVNLSTNAVQNLRCE